MGTVWVIEVLDIIKYVRLCIVSLQEFGSVSIRYFFLGDSTSFVAVVRFYVGHSIANCLFSRDVQVAHVGHGRSYFSVSSPNVTFVSTAPRTRL